MATEDCSCFLCGQILQRDRTLAIGERDSGGFTYGGLRFWTNGNYGSRLFDPCDRSEAGARLEIIICDDCIESRASEVTYVRAQRQVQNTVTATHTFKEQLAIEDEEFARMPKREE